MSRSRDNKGDTKPQADQRQDLFGWRERADAPQTATSTRPAKSVPASASSTATSSSSSSSTSSSKSVRPKKPVAASTKSERPRTYARQSAERSFKTKGLASLVSNVTKKAIGTKGSIEADLQIYWREIIGAPHDQSTWPVRVRFDHPRRRIGGVLEVVVERGFGAFATHAKGQLLERLNSYLGLGTLRDIKFKEGPLPNASARAASQRVAKPAPVQHIDLSDARTRERLGLYAQTTKRSNTSGAEPARPWMPQATQRHKLVLTMDDRQGTGVEHKPLADALTYLGASLANKAVDP